MVKISVDGTQPMQGGSKVPTIVIWLLSVILLVAVEECVELILLCRRDYL